MTIIYGNTNRVARTLDEALPDWYVEADEDRAYAHKVDPRRHPDFYDQLEIHATPDDDGWLVQLMEQRTEMGLPEELDSMRASHLDGVKRAARALKRRWSQNQSIGDRAFDFGGGL